MNSAASSLSRRQWLGLAALGAGLADPQRIFAAPAPAAGGAPADARVYDIRGFGASGDGKTLDTAALQAAVDACSRAGGGVVLVPAGTFLIGTVELRSFVTLRLEPGARLLGSADGRQYRAADAIPLHGDSTLEDGNCGLLFAVEAVNLTIEGPGTIDGQGLQFHPPTRGALPPSGRGGNDRPYHLLFYRCRNLRVRDLELYESAYHSVRVVQCTRAYFDGLYIHNRVNYNNDGFHFISCEHVAVSNCTVWSQDDACALFGSCRFVTVTNCAFSTRWSVFRFGGGTAENVAVSNCIFHQVFGCPIKLHCGPGSRFERLSFSDLVLSEVTGPINFSVGPYAHRRGGAAPAPGRARPGEPPPIVRDVSFSHIHGTVTTDPPPLPDYPFAGGYGAGEKASCIAINAAPDAVVERIAFDDVHLVFGGGGTAEQAARRELPLIFGEYFDTGPMPAYAFYARNARGLTLSNVRFELAKPDLRPALVLDRVEDVAVNGLSVQGDPGAESVARFTAVRQALLSAVRLLRPAAVFLQLEGPDNAGVTVDGGDLSPAAAPLACRAGAQPSAARLRG